MKTYSLILLLIGLFGGIIGCSKRARVQSHSTTIVKSTHSNFDPSKAKKGTEESLKKIDSIKSPSKGLTIKAPNSGTN